MTLHPQVAIVILNWNGASFLKEFLPSVLKTTYPNHRVIVADNGSTDDSLQVLNNQFSTVEIIKLPENYGFAGGYNEALKEVDADYFMLLNSDVEVEPNWLQPLVQLMEENKNIGACGPKILSYKEKNKFEYAGGAGGWIDAWGFPFARGRVFETLEEDKGQYNDNAPVFWASGAALLIRSHLYKELGGFDASFFAHMEEIDLCWRLQLEGHLVYACPASVVYHLGGGTLPQGASRKTFLNFRNNALMMAKNLPPSEKLWRIPLRLGLDQIAATRMLLKGDLPYFRTVIKAHLSFLKMAFGGSRNSANRRSLKGLKGVFRGSVVQKYFMEGKKTFQEIIQEKI